MVENPEELIAFLKAAFFAVELNRSVNPQTGEIANVILKIGTSCFMFSQAILNYWAIVEIALLLFVGYACLYEKPLDLTNPRWSFCLNRDA